MYLQYNSINKNFFVKPFVFKGHIPCRFIITMCLAAFSLNAAAHHSAARFDFNNRVEVKGIVKVLEVANPHTKLILEIKDENGNVKEIEFEGHSRNNIYRRGWRPDILKAGDSVTIRISPTRSGEDGGYVNDFILEDGRQF